MPPSGAAVRPESKRLLEQGPAAVGLARVGEHLVEPLERNLRGNVRMHRDQRRVVRLHDRELVAEPFGVGEAQASVLTRHVDALGAESRSPEGQRLLGRDP